MDISELLSSLSPEDMEKLKGTAESLLSGVKSTKEEPEQPESLIDPSMLSVMTRLGNALNGDDDRTRLIKALKPMLSSEKQEKADEAVKILRLIRLASMIRDSGGLNNLI
ncbi:MAG: hypothetical protein LUG85_01405 [Clostridiales bacterium]|nr:hypothetical protein [Clostridiales bacterium]MCD7827182.1 hypothetical protein [Clostridiales bacterium]